MNVTTIGLDITKSVFSVRDEDVEGGVVLTRRLKLCAPGAGLTGIEACGSAHYWAPVLAALGHEVRLIAAAYVGPFVGRNKTGARDAAAIWEAVRRPSMRCVRIKTEEQQAAGGLENARDMLVRQHTQLTNGVRDMLAELGMSPLRPARLQVACRTDRCGGEPDPAGVAACARGLAAAMMGRRRGDRDARDASGRAHYDKKRIFFLRTSHIIYLSPISQ
jgi:transposase